MPLTSATVQKVVVDSRHRRGPSSNFVLELPESVETGDNCGVLVTDVSLFVSWPSIGAHNDRIYLIEKRDDSEALEHRIVRIAHGQYTSITLADALEVAFNGGAEGTPEGYLVVYDGISNQLTIQNPTVSFLPVDEEHVRNTLIADWPAEAEEWDPANPLLANATVGVGPLAWAGWPPPLTKNYVSSSVIVGALNAVHIVSDVLAANQVLTSKGRVGILKTVPVASVYGTALTAGWGGFYEEAVPCSNQLLRRIDFRVVNHDGVTVETGKAPLSLSLVFMELKG